MGSKRRFLAAVAGLAAVVLAGCGSSSGLTSGDSRPSPTNGGDASSGSNSKIDVCKIITPADAQKVVGGPVAVQTPSSTESLASGVCTYKATGGGIRVSLLQVRVYPGPQFYGEQAGPNTKSLDLDGTDKAFVRETAGGKRVDVQFVKDDTTGTINFDAETKAPDAAVKSVEAVAQKLADAI